MKYLIGLVVGAVVLGFVAVQFLLEPSSTSEEASDTAVVTTETAAVEPVETDTFSGNGTLESLVLRNEPIECSVIHRATDSEVTGTVFMSDGRMRADMLQTTPGMTEPVLSSMIMVDDVMYTWSEIDGQQYGVKMDVSKATDTSEVYDQGPIKAGEPVNYTCKLWQSVDASVFVPPSTVLFQDMNTLMQTGMEYGTVYNKGEF